MEIGNELRTRLASVSIDDLDAVHALYLDTQRFLSEGRKGVGETLDEAELARRVERAEGLAIRAAQSRGELRSRYQVGWSPNAKFVTDYINSAGTRTRIYSLTDGVTDEVFEQAIGKCRAEGNLSRNSVIGAISQIPTDPPPPAPAAVRVALPTRRGRKTVEHMAIQLNALALGVTDLDPGEVDKAAMLPMINQAFEDIGVLRTFLRKVNKQ